MPGSGQRVDDLFRLDGKVAVVTGGSRGLGKAMVLGFAAAGADTVIASRKRDACEAVAGEVSGTTGRRAVGVACHVGRWTDCDELVAAAYDAFGRVDVLVNNAGMSPLYGDDPTAVTEELWRKVIDVNLTGPFRLAALFGARMVADGGGSIINISSGAALQATASVIPYGAAKAGLQAVTTGLADAYGPSVRVNTIVAGRFRTDVSEAWDMESLEADLRRSQPLQRVGEPEEIVGTALYLTSDASSYTTGAMIRVDGGAVL